MQNTISQYVAGTGDNLDQINLRALFFAVATPFVNQTLNTAGLVISGTTTKVKTGAAVCYAILSGVLVKISAATDMAVLAGTVTNAKFNVFAFFVDASGTLTSAMGTEGATLAAVKFPPIPATSACLGFVIINPTGTGNFVGGTTPLGDATVVPNAAYVSITGAFDPSIAL